MSNKRGRPASSRVRQNLVEILYFAKRSYGYDLYRHYLELFPKVTLRLIYYHLRKGVQLGVFRIDEIAREKGEYSWGEDAEKTYYVLGPNASPLMDKKVVEYFDNFKKRE